MVHSCTETWVAENAKLGLTGKHLRDWIVAQLTWADDNRLGKLRAADYLNAGTRSLPPCPLPCGAHAADGAHVRTRLMVHTCARGVARAAALYIGCV